MAKTVGLSRRITLQWMNTAVDLLGRGLSEEEYKSELNSYLAFEIESPTVLRKTREILMNIWFFDDDTELAKTRNKAKKLLEKYPEDRLPVYWCMLLAAYPVFADLSKMIGRFSEYYDTIKLKSIKQKLYDEWGERSTLYHSTDKIMATMKAFDALSTTKPGDYTIVKHDVRIPEIVDFMLYVAMKIDKSSYYEFTELNGFAILFPFEYNVSKEYILSDPDFTATHFAGEMTLSLKE